MSKQGIKRLLPRIMRDYIENIDSHIDKIWAGMTEARSERARLAARIARLELIVEALTDDSGVKAGVLAALATDDVSVLELWGTRMVLHDHNHHLAATILDELNHGSFGLRTIPFQPGDVVIDVGANIGVVSIFLALHHPGLRILAVEPNPRSFADLLRNIEMNKTSNITAINLAVTADGQDCTLHTPVGDIHTSSTLWPRHISASWEMDAVHATTLDQVFLDHGIERCHLLKIDCEGCEHEILPNSTLLDRVEYLSIESHESALLRQQGFSNQTLRRFCEQHFPSGRLWFDGVIID